MKVRTLLVATAAVSMVIGATVLWLVLTVPNDVQAELLLKQAHAAVATGNNAKARSILSRVVQQYPRTDGAAAATVALASLDEQEHQKLANDLASVRRDAEAQSKEIGDLTQKVTELQNAPKPAPPQLTVQAPKRKAATPHRRHTRARRSRRHR